MLDYKQVSKTKVYFFYGLSSPSREMAGVFLRNNIDIIFLGKPLSSL